MRLRCHELSIMAMIKHRNRNNDQNSGKIIGKYCRTYCLSVDTPRRDVAIVDRHWHRL